MARKKPATTKRPRPGRRWGWRIALIFLTLLALLAGWMHLTARTVHVRRAEVRIGDLPPGFDGTTILFASDIDLCGAHTARQADSMFAQLQSLNPDMLLLGGDYASASILDRLNGRGSEEESAARTAFFKALRDFHAPLGKFAVAGDNDGSPDALMLSMMDSGVKLIDGTAEIIVSGTDAIAVVGVGAQTGDIAPLAARLPADRCVIALTHSPEQVVRVRISEAQGGGSWADLILSGHTHGGQIRIAGRSLFSLTDAEKRYLSGWYADAAALLLVTEGVGCEGANFRLGTEAEVWLITLRTK